MSIHCDHLVKRRGDDSPAPLLEGKEGIIDFVPFETETLDGVWTEGITALVERPGAFFVVDYPLSGDDAGEAHVLEVGRDFERVARCYREITGFGLEGVA